MQIKTVFDLPQFTYRKHTFDHTDFFKTPIDLHAALVLVFTITFLLVIYYSRWFEIHQVPRRLIMGIFVVKIIVGFGLAWIYTDHYTNRRTGDAFRFFDDAQIMYSSLDEGFSTYAKLITGIGISEDPAALSYYNRMTHLERPFYQGFFNDNATIIRANALVMLFSRGHYHVHTVFWCFFSLVGLTALARLFLSFFPRKKWGVLFAVFFLPTVLFWGSGVLKEPILIMGLGLFLEGFFKWWKGERLTKLAILTTILGFILLLYTKGYVLQCMAPALIGLALYKLNGRKRFWWSFTIPHLLVGAMVFIGPYVSNGLKVAELMRLKQEAFYNVAQESQSGSIKQLPSIDSNSSVIFNLPEANFITYFRPLPWEWTKMMFIPPALENLALVLCILVMFWNFKLPPKFQWPMIAFSLSFVIVLGGLTGQVVPVVGAIVRYKLPSLIFLFVAIFAFTDEALLARRLPILKRFLK